MPSVDKTNETILITKNHAINENVDIFFGLKTRLKTMLYSPQLKVLILPSLLKRLNKSVPGKGVKMVNEIHKNLLLKKLFTINNNKRR